VLAREYDAVSTC